MFVAQKRLRTHEFWHWFLGSTDAPYPRRSPISIGHLSWKAEIQGSLPGNRRLAKPFKVRVTWDHHEWLVSDPAYHMHTVGPTISKAVAGFRALLCDYLEGLSEREDRSMSQPLQDQLAYLREMITV
jgi:hypothetical protein